MKTFPCIRSISSVLIPCLLFLSVGCYSYQAQKETKDLRRGEKLIVATTDGHYYRLSIWWLDAEGNLTGSGKAYQSESDAVDENNGERFQGTLLAQEIASVQAERFSVPLTLGLLGLALLISGAALLLLFAVGMSGFQK